MAELTQAQRDTFDQLQDALSVSASAQELFTAGPLRWYSKLLTDLVLILDDDEVIYANSIREPEVFTVGVFTAKYLVWVVVAQPDDQDSVVRLQMVKRTDIIDLSVNATVGLLDSDPDQSWPGDVTIAAVYPDIGLVAIPLEAPLVGPVDGLQLLAALKADLLADR